MFDKTGKSPDRVKSLSVTPRGLNSLKSKANVDISNLWRSTSTNPRAAPKYHLPTAQEPLNLKNESLFVSSLAPNQTLHPKSYFSVESKLGKVRCPPTVGFGKRLSSKKLSVEYPTHDLSAKYVVQYPMKLSPSEIEYNPVMGSFDMSNLSAHSKPIMSRRKKLNLSLREMYKEQEYDYGQKSTTEI